MTHVALFYDMRSPDWGPPTAELYRAAVEQCRWLDGLEAAASCSVGLSEHHATPDGYLPSPIVLGAAVAGATSRMQISFNLLLLPFYHPIRLAEDLAVLDLASGGRLSVMFGAGYRPEEFAQYGMTLADRAAAMDEGVEVLKAAWTGEPFEFRGSTVQVRPRPLQRPRPEIVLGGASMASAVRAARLADGYAPLGEEFLRRYEAEAAALGRPAKGTLSTTPDDFPLFVHVTEDPERDWEIIGRHAMYDTSEYGKFDSPPGSPYRAYADLDELKASGRYRVVTPEECATLASIGFIAFKPLMGGLDPDMSWSSLELFATAVLPRLTPPQDE